MKYALKKNYIVTSRWRVLEGGAYYRRSWVLASQWYSRRNWKSEEANHEASWGKDILLYMSTPSLSNKQNIIFFKTLLKVEFQKYFLSLSQTEKMKIIVQKHKHVLAVKNNYPIVALVK